MNYYKNLTMLWDFDGTLGYRKTGWSGSILRTLDEEIKNHNFTIQDIKPFTKGGFFWDAYEKEHTNTDTPEKWWEETRKIFYKAFLGLGFREKESFELSLKAQKVFLDFSEFTLYPDTIEVLKHFKENGCQNIIVSNNFPELYEVICHLQIDQYINHCISSGNIGYEKPNVKIFNYALKKAVNTENVWMVGDNPVADVQGANNAGIKAILVRSTKTPDIKYYSDNLSGVIKIVEGNDNWSK